MTNEKQLSEDPKVEQSKRNKVRQVFTTTLKSIFPLETGTALANTDVAVTDTHFEERICRNCGETCTTAYCSSCGQAMSKRFTYRDVGKEIWERYRLFEMDIVRMAFRLLIRPGTVAREYVLGARKRYLHPLNFLLVAIGFLVLALNQTHYLTAGLENLSSVMAQIETWSQWSFSLGLFAILLSSTIVFWRRLNYNIVEQAILAAYTQIAIIAVNLINLAPLLFFNRPEWIKIHRQTANMYMTWIELAIVTVAYMQFFRVRLKGNWQEPGERKKLISDILRLTLAVAGYYLIKKGLLLAYGRFIVYMVLGQ